MTDNSTVISETSFPEQEKSVISATFLQLNLLLSK